MKKILIIEDEMDIAELERDYLEINGFQVTIVTDGESGLNEALSHHHDLIILDIMLPKIDGYALCKKLRQTLDIPVIIVSAKKDEIDKIRGLGIGADDYITKPFSPQEMVARIKSHLSRYERLKSGTSQNQRELQFNALRIEPDSRRVYLEEKEILLTTKEFDLLFFLASNADRVFSKDYLFEKIWGLDSSGDVSTVTVHIRRLRSKIEVNPSHPRYIETLWGAGYRFIKNQSH